MKGLRTVEDLVDLGERVLGDSTHIFEDHDNRAEAKQLIALTIKTAPDGLDGSAPVSARDRDRYLALVARRAAGEPMPFLTGRIEFYGLDLKVRPGAFVPRPSSELMVAQAASRLKRRTDPIVVDACTGAGPIAMALADEFPNARVWGTDIDAGGLSQARANARRLGLGNVSFRRGDMYGALPRTLAGAVDVITAHVPYVPADELEDLPSEVREHEPVHTLSDESDDGLHLMRRAVAEGPQWLRPGGWLLLEMSDDIAPDVEQLCFEFDYVHVGTVSDDDDLSVVVEAQIPKGHKRPR
jgi:release factor glutamine methyltransferase